MQNFIETLNRWYDQMLSVPPAKIMSLISMGAKVVNFLELRPRQEEAKERLIFICRWISVFSETEKKEADDGTA